MRALAADTAFPSSARSRARACRGRGPAHGRHLERERAQQARRLPSALVTTPESLSLMLSNADAREKLSELRLVVVDEWHELLGNKRGVHDGARARAAAQLESAAARVGLSATLGNIDEALDRLAQRALRRRVVKGVSDKKVVMDTLIPPRSTAFRGRATSGSRCSTRGRGDRRVALDARLHQRALAGGDLVPGLLEARPEWAGSSGCITARSTPTCAAGSSRAQGRALKAVVATSSLDLGVDFLARRARAADRQPKGVARLLQRAGRSGHAPGR
jgi:ATP-dependent Lhr-like helicase